MTNFTPDFRKSKSTWVCLALALLAYCSPLAALAAQMSFTPTTGNCGTINIKMPIHKIAGVEIPRGRIAIHDNTIDVTMIPEWMFDRQIALSGPVLRVVSSIEGSRASIIGIGYFQSGPWLKYVDDPTKPDILVTAAGTMTGKIVSADQSAVVLQQNGKQLTIPLADLRDIHSPRAYTFTIPATLISSVPAATAYQAEATGITLRPTSGSYKLGVLKTDLAKESGDWSTSKIVLLGSVFSALELAQLVTPMVFALETKHLQSRELAVQRNALSEEAAFPPPIIPYTQIDVPSPIYRLIPNVPH